MARKLRKGRDFGAERFFVIVLSIALAGSLFTTFYLINARSDPTQLSLISPEVSADTDLSTDGYVQVLPSASIVENQGVVSLKSNCREIIATTEVDQAKSIILGLQNVIEGRPNTHDLVKDYFNNFGVEVVMAKVLTIRDGNYIGRLVLKQGNTIISLDSRPSDGIALAVRARVPIYFNETLFNEHARKIC